MAMATLKDVYLDQLHDLYDACQQSREITQELNTAASHRDLQAALMAGVNGIEDGISTLADIIKKHGQDPGAETCHAMAGMVKEARIHALDEGFTDDDIRDAVIITEYQRMAHYAIAGYGSLLAFAKRLDLPEDAEKLKTCLDASYSGDHTMTEIATSGVNASAA